jgi:hypothetical protein
MSKLTESLREYADYRATSDDLSRVLFKSADVIESLTGALRDMLSEFDDPTVTDDLKTQIGMSANTVKALQRARAAAKACEA